MSEPKSAEIPIIHSKKPNYAELEAQLSRLESKYSKENTYLTQKIELMEMKLKEAKEREESIEKLHNTMLNAFKNNSNDKQVNFVQEYEYLTEVHRSDMAQVVKSYDMQISHLKEKNSELLEKNSGLTESCDSMQKEIKRLLTENTQLEKKILLLEKDQEIEGRLKIERVVMEANLDKEHTQSQIKHQQDEFKLKEDQWKNQLKNLTEEINKLKKDTKKEKGFNLNSVISLEKQVAELSKELSITKAQNSELKKSTKAFEKQVSNLRKAPVKYMSLDEESQSDDHYNLLRKLEKLHQKLEIKDQEIEELNATYKSLINNERQKVIETKEKLINLREKFDEKRNQYTNELLEKDEQIVTLTKQIRNCVCGLSPSTHQESVSTHRNSELANGRKM